MEVGIDVGGTHTRVAVAEGGTVLHESASLTAEWLEGILVADERNAERLLALVPDGAVGREDVPLVVGANGCDTQALCDRLATWLRQRHPGPVLTLNDSELFGPTLGLARAISLVCGTGSIVVGRDADGALVKVGGHGWLLGDPGAAPSLVREAVVAILHAGDAGAAPGILARSLMAHYGCGDAVQLGYAVTADAEATRWGALSPLVFEAADAGDPLARGVIETAAVALAADVVHLRDKGVHCDDVVLGGGVIVAQPRLEAAIRAALAEVLPDARVHVLRDAPVHGALVLAAGLRPLDRVPDPYPAPPTNEGVHTS